MKTIYKFPLEITDEQYIEVPIGTRLLHVGVKDGILCVWGFVPDSQKPKHRRKIIIVGTGNPAGDVAVDRYIGTAQISIFVWHVFEG